MLPGRQFTADDILEILRRRFWLVLVPAALAAGVAALYARGLPDQYFSYSRIMVVPQRISESLVRNAITASIEDRLPAIRSQVLSRTSLERIIAEFDLYREERQRLVMAEVVEMMEGEIWTEISGPRQDTFIVGYSGTDPVKVTNVAERLGQLFIERSLGYRTDLIEDTTSFLDAELEEKRRQLEAVEQRLANYQRQHAGELPSQQLANIQQLQAANTRIQAAVDTINRARERRLSLEQQLANVRSMSDPTPIASEGPPPAGSTLERLRAAQEEVAAFEARGLRPGHPDLDAALRRVRDLSAQVAAESNRNPNEPALPPAEVARRNRMAQLQSEIDEVDRQIALAQEDERRARELAQTTQARIDAAPMREAEVIKLTRDYEIMDSAYRDLLTKRETARLSANLEQRQVGEQFSIVDPARIPERPSSPNRLRLTLMGLALGFGLGVAVAGVLEFRDRTIRSDEDLALVLDLPVLAVVPVMESASERRRHMLRRILLHGTCTLLVAAGVSLVVYALAG